LLVAEHDGSAMFARIGVMRALSAAARLLGTLAVYCALAMAVRHFAGVTSLWTDPWRTLPALMFTVAWLAGLGLACSSLLGWRRGEFALRR